MNELNPFDLIHAYCEGVFPMGERDGSISWYRPPMRGILPISDFHVPQRFERYLRTQPFEIRWNTAFGDVVRGCADRETTWITDTIIDVYEKLFEFGFAHSAEVWRDGRLRGGVYGVAIGGAFFGESMFSREPQASKVALTFLQRRLHERQFVLHDTQWTTKHLAMFGGHEIPNEEYMERLKKAIHIKTRFMDEKAALEL